MTLRLQAGAQWVLVAPNHKLSRLVLDVPSRTIFDILYVIFTMFQLSEM